MRAYKPLRAYSHMEGGHVRMMMNINKCAESTIFMFVRGYCLPSQSTTHVYPVHVCLDKHSGVEYGAACRCVAGLGECCTHVAAVLFKLDDLMTRGLKAIPEDLARTEKSCAWIAPANLASVKAVPLDEVLAYKPVVDKAKPEKPAIGLEMFHPVPLHLLKPAPGRAGELAAKLRQTSPTCTFAWSFDVQQYAQPPAEPHATPASLEPLAKMGDYDLAYSRDITVTASVSAAPAYESPQDACVCGTLLFGTLYPNHPCPLST